MRAIIMMIKTLIRKLRFRPNEFRFKCAFPRELNIAISLSRDFNQLSLALNSAYSLIEFFSGNKYIIGIDEAKPLIADFLFKDKVEFIPDSELKKDPFEMFPDDVDLIWDLSKPPTPHAKLPLYAKNSKYRISTDPETYPYYNIILAPSPESDDINYFEKQLKLMNVPLLRFKPSLRDLAKRTAWDYLIFKGHGEQHILIVIDIRDKAVAELVRSASKTAFLTGVTFVSPHDLGNGIIDISPLGPEGIAATMSLADLFVFDNSLYLGIAALMKIPILLINSEVKLPENLVHRSWRTDAEIGQLVEDIRSLVE